MKLNDAVWGALLLLLSAALLVHVQSFPTIPGQQVGPALFPGIIARRARRVRRAARDQGPRRAARRRRARGLDRLRAWTRHRRYVVAFVVTVGVNVFYIFAVDRLGFIITGTIYLAVLFWVFGVGRKWVLPIAVIVNARHPLRVLQAPQGAAAVGTAAGSGVLMGAWAQAFALVFHPYNIFVMLAASLFGLFVGAVPGLTATMATALLVPITFFMAPIPAIAAIVTATAMAIFSGDIPGCLMRMPGTPASAAYTDEAYAMTRKGQAELALGAGLVFSAIGGLFGTAVLIVGGAHARRVRAQVLVVRVFLAGAARPDVRGVHDVGPAAQGLRVAAARACSSPAWASAIRPRFLASRSAAPR